VLRTRRSRLRWLRCCIHEEGRPPRGRRAGADVKPRQAASIKNRRRECCRKRRSGTCLRFHWRPAWRRRDFDSGRGEEQRNLSRRCNGRRASGQLPQAPEYRGGAQGRRRQRLSGRQPARGGLAWIRPNRLSTVGR